jgi:glycosyltransferase involved in cell wall biosynthesis
VSRANAAPVVSICIPNYNYARFLPEAIESALAQTYAHTEIVVVDDASTDDSMAVLERYRSNPKVRVFRNEKTTTIAPNHNIAASHARGDYLSFLSSDDVLKPTFVERTLGVYERFDGRGYDLGLVMAERDLIDAGGHSSAFVPFYGASFVCKGERQAKVAMVGNPGAPSLWLVKATALREVGGFNPIYGTAHDWECFFKLCCRFDFGYLQEVLCSYRWHQNLSTTTLANLKYICNIHVMKVDIAARVADHPYLSRFADEAVRRTASNALKFAIEALKAGNLDAARRHVQIAAVFDEAIRNSPLYQAIAAGLDDRSLDATAVLRRVGAAVNTPVRTEPYPFPDEVERFER